MHDFETIEKSYFTIDFIFAGSIWVKPILRRQSRARKKPPAMQVEKVL